MPTYYPFILPPSPFFGLFVFFLLKEAWFFQEVAISPTEMPASPDPLTAFGRYCYLQSICQKSLGFQDCFWKGYKPWVCVFWPLSPLAVWNKDGSHLPPQEDECKMGEMADQEPASSWPLTLNHCTQASNWVKRWPERVCYIMVKVVHSHKNLSSNGSLTLRDLKWTLVCFISYQLPSSG